MIKEGLSIDTTFNLQLFSSDITLKQANFKCPLKKRKYEVWWETTDRPLV